MTPASYSWTIDLTAPNTPTVSHSPGAYNNNQTLTFTSNGSSVIRFEYTIDGSVPVDPTTASFTGSLTTSIADGQDVTYRVKRRHGMRRVTQAVVEGFIFSNRR